MEKGKNESEIVYIAQKKHEITYKSDKIYKRGLRKYVRNDIKVV